MPFSEVRDVDIELGSLTIPLALKKKKRSGGEWDSLFAAEENTPVQS